MLILIAYKVAGLARVHDSSTLKKKNDTLVSHDKDLLLPGDETALDHCVPTRWNSDLTCLDAHLYFRSLSNNSLELQSTSCKKIGFQMISGILQRH